MPINDILNRLDDAERAFTGSQFLAPMIGRAGVLVRIAGVVCRMKKLRGLPRAFEGWAVLRATSTSAAEFMRPASLTETAEYLALFPAVPLVLAQRADEGAPGSWLAFPAQRGDMRFKIQGPVVVRLCGEGLERFETVVTRFDGRQFWYERRSPGRDPSLAAYLRAQLLAPVSDGLPPAKNTLHARGLSAEERDAYGFVRALLAEARRDQVEVRLSEALAHAGAELRAYVERGDAYVVSYLVDGRPQMSTIRRDDLSVLTAGICLSGEDQVFDLTSLVGVLREADETGRLVRVGEADMSEDDYRAAHPPNA
jgi:hypothetical protein